MLLESRESTESAYSIEIKSDSLYDADWHLLRRTKAPSGDARFSETVSVADLFCGCGGLSLGVREACSTLGLSFEAELAVDNHAAAIETYRKNFTPRYSSDLSLEAIVDGNFGESLTFKEMCLLDQISGPTLLLAGPPCQGHSSLNNHTRHSDDRNTLYERVARFAEITLPDHAIIENVPDVRHSESESVQKTKEHFLSLGYKCDEAVINLADIGVPQSRKRHMLVASKVCALEEGVYLDSLIFSHKVESRRTVGWAILDLEDVDAATLLDSAAVLSKENLVRAEFLLENDSYDLPNRLRPICHQNEDHSYKSMYGRLDYAKPAQTITTGFGSPGQGRYLHPRKCRTITPHEAARLQFFPDYFDFSPAKKRGDLSRMIGNAVPMKLTQIVALDLLRKVHA